MNEFFKALGHFITRDIIYLIGGGAIVTSFLYCFCYIPKSGEPVVVYLLGAGISYVVGYALQDGFSLTPFVRTTIPLRVSCFVKWLYRRFTREEWQEIANEFDFDKARECITEKWQVDKLERIITLKHVGTTVGPCTFVCSLLIGWKWFSSQCKSTFDLTLFITAFALSIVLVCLGWIKVAQQAQFLRRHGSG